MPKNFGDIFDLLHVTTSTRPPYIFACISSSSIHFTQPSLVQYSVMCITNLQNLQPTPPCPVSFLVLYIRQAARLGASEAKELGLAWHGVRSGSSVAGTTRMKMGTSASASWLSLGTVRSTEYSYIQHEVCPHRLLPGWRNPAEDQE